MDPAHAESKESNIRGIAINLGRVALESLIPSKSITIIPEKNNHLPNFLFNIFYPFMLKFLKNNYIYTNLRLYSKITEMSSP